MSKLAKALMQGAAGSSEPVYVEDVFSTYLYTGNGSTQTITNGINLSGKGGLVWLKGRSTVSGHGWYDTARGAQHIVQSNANDADYSPFSGVTSFNSNGFTIGANDNNGNGDVEVSWTFRKQAKFFDIVTWTGTGSTRNISHSLGSVPGCIIVKRTDSSGYAWQVYHRSSTAAGKEANESYLTLNSSEPVNGASSTKWGSTTPTSTYFKVGSDETVNASGGTYVAYIFAHDAGGFGTAGTDNVISCGSFTAGGTSTPTEVNLGYEAQWLLVKKTTDSMYYNEWRMVDIMRGMPEPTATASVLCANLSDSESTGDLYATATATGFKIQYKNASVSGSTFIYIAIRRPMKPPTTGTEVFQPVVYTGTNVDNRLVDTTIAPDMIMARQRDASFYGFTVGSRILGDKYLITGSTAGSVSDADSLMTPTVGVGNSFSAMSGFGVGNDITSKVNYSTSSNNHVALAFKRSPGFFETVTWTGDGTSDRIITHGLGATPEFIIVKRLDTSSTIGWPTYCKTSSGHTNLLFNQDWSESYGTSPSTYGTPDSPTSTTFRLRTPFGYKDDVNANGGIYIAYLFASLDGISKVGTYVGNGTTNVVNCGFTNGARFVLLRGYEYNQAWAVLDTARGIGSSTSAILTTDKNWADDTSWTGLQSDSSGFKLTSGASANWNANGGNYIYLAIA